jgi:EpsI family protein
LGSKEKRIVISCLLVLLTGAFVYKLRYSRAEVESVPTLQSIPLIFEPWRGEDFPLDERTSQILGADLNLHRRYTHREGHTLWLFMSYFRDQRYGSQIHSPQNCLPGSGWAIVTKEKVILEIGQHNLQSRFLKATKGGKALQVYYWFVTRSGILSDEYALKSSLVCNALRGRPTDAFFVRLTTDAERAVVENFLRALWPQIAELLPPRA